MYVGQATAWVRRSRFVSDPGSANSVRQKGIRPKPFYLGQRVGLLFPLVAFVAMLDWTSRHPTAHEKARH